MLLADWRGSEGVFDWVADVEAQHERNLARAIVWYDYLVAR